jgi:hypothetical protein
MRTRFRLVFMCMLAAALAAGAIARAAHVSSKPTLGDLMVQYWPWYTGARVPGQVKNIVFIPLPAGEPSEEDPTLSVGELDVTLRGGQSFTLPVFLYIGESYAEKSVPADNPADVPAGVFTDAEVFVTLDGKPLIDSDNDDLSDFFFDTRYFPRPIRYATPTEYAPDVHAVASIWLQGLGLVHGPIAKGRHTLDLFVHSDILGIGYHNTWHITVK